VEPIFRGEDFVITTGIPSAYSHRSEGSGKFVTIHFCGTCGSKSHLSFERFPEVVGVYAGGFDDPNWFEISAENSKHIFLEAARKETIIPSGIPTFRQHAINNDGTACLSTIYETFHQVRQAKD